MKVSKFDKSALTHPLAAISVALVATLGARAATLPDDYTELEYIESTGSQYIDTGLLPTAATALEIKYKLTAAPSTSVVVFGYNTGSAPIFYFGLNTGGKVAGGYGGYGGQVYRADAYNTVVRTLTFDAESKEFRWDGTKILGPISSSWSGTPGPLYLFARNNGSSAAGKSKIRLYSCAFSALRNADGDTVDAEFVPCRQDATGRFGLYETKSGRFCGNAASGDDFTPGLGLGVAGSPAACGEPSPGYGVLPMDGLEKDETYKFNPPANGATDDAVWACTGWEFETLDGEKTTGEGAVDITYEEPATLTWLFDCSFKVEFDCSGGDVDTNTLWYAGGTQATVTFTPAAKHRFKRWEGDVLTSQVRDNPLVLTVDGPKSIRALTSKVLEVGPGKEYADIASAVQDAEDDDEILVYDGTYEINAQIELTNAITVRSVNGPEVTTVTNVNTSGESGKAVVRRVFLINNPEARVEGFTITGGKVINSTNNGGSGVGVQIGANGGTLADCIVTGCKSGRMVNGGGVALLSDAAVVTGCIIRNNTSSGWKSDGAGVYMKAGCLTSCVITNNATTYDKDSNGGGLYAETGTKMSVDHCLFKDNASAGGGGGVMCSSGSPTFENCTIVANRSTTGVGGVDCAGGTASFYGCIFADNTSSASSADAAWPEVAPTGAKSFKYCVCTKTLPVGKSTGCRSDVPANLGPDGVTPLQASAAVDLCPAGDYTGLADQVDLFGNPRLSGDGVDAGCAEYQYPDVAISIAAPKSRSVVGTREAFEAKAYVKGASSYEYRWTADDGTDSGWVTDPVIALSFAAAGHRTVTLTVRADNVEKTPVSVEHEVSAKDIYVVPYAEGHVPAFPYETWATAATNIAASLAAAADGSTVHVTNGTYEVAEQIVVDDYGVTIASVNGPAVTTVANVNTASETGKAVLHRVFLLDHPQARLEGLTISGGNVKSAVNTTLTGVGVLIDAKGGTLANCVVTGCSFGRYAYGGGVALLSDAAVVTNCVIRNNADATWRSIGTVYMTAGLVTHCVISNNAVRYDGDSAGGGVYATGGRVSHCAIFGNRTSGNGAGLFCGNAAVVVDNCLVNGNTAANGGGVYSSASKLVNCTIRDNSASKLGGGVYCTAATPVFRNCLIQGNVMTGADTAATTNFSGTAANYTYCSSPEELPGGTASGNVQATVALNSRSVPRAGSAAVDKGSVTGYEDYLVGGTDLLGKPRVFRKVVDIGCCENQSGGMLLMVR